MTDHEKNEQKIDQNTKEEKKEYESPAVADEGSFETVVLSCPLGSFETCGGVSS